MVEIKHNDPGGGAVTQKMYTPARTAPRYPYPHWAKWHPSRPSICVLPSMGVPPRAQWAIKREQLQFVHLCATHLGWYPISCTTGCFSFSVEKSNMVGAAVMLRRLSFEWKKVTGINYGQRLTNHTICKFSVRHSCHVQTTLGYWGDNTQNILIQKTL